LRKQKIKDGNLAANSGVFIHKEKRSKSAPHSMDEVHARYEPTVDTYIFDSDNYYDYSPGYNSFV
jgi:hypothetical protein